jgi:Flp pilus assembly protein TadB
MLLSIRERGDIEMRRLWHDSKAHKPAAALFLMYWLTTLAVVLVTWSHGIPGEIVILLLTTPLIAGVLVGRWRASTPERTARSRDRIMGGMLAGGLIAGITLLVMKGGVGDVVIGGMHGDRFRGGEVLGVNPKVS